MKEVELEGYNNYAYATDQQAQQRTLQHRQEAPRPQQLPPPLQLHRLHHRGLQRRLQEQRVRPSLQAAPPYPPHQPIRTVPASLPVHFSGLRPRERSAARGLAACRRLPHAGVLDRLRDSLVLPRYSCGDADMRAQSKLPEPRLPVFVDDEMIYMSVPLKQVFFAERDGAWNEETVGHPKLSLSARFNEKEWFDRQQIF